jgi:hypothetical protein
MENLSLPAPYPRLFHWRLSASYSVAPRAAARLARHLFRPYVKANRSLKSIKYYAVKT